jgi:hypothetical protein
MVTRSERGNATARTAELDDNQKRNRGGRLKPIFSILALSLAASWVAYADNKDAEVRATIQTFYKNFNEGFTGPADYATEDWNHINPNGGRNQGREATLKRLREVHQTFLKGAKESIESMDVRFAADGVAEWVAST